MGFFFCVVFLCITAPPTFTTTPPQYVEAKEGGNTQLSCTALGNPKPMISWLREGEELVTNSKYSVSSTNKISQKKTGKCFNLGWVHRDTDIGAVTLVRSNTSSETRSMLVGASLSTGKALVDVFK